MTGVQTCALPILNDEWFGTTDKHTDASTMLLIPFLLHDRLKISVEVRSTVHRLALQTSVDIAFVIIVSQDVGHYIHRPLRQVDAQRQNDMLMAKIAFHFLQHLPKPLVAFDRIADPVEVDPTELATFQR